MTLRDQAVAFTAREQAELVTVQRNDAPLGPDEVAGPTLATVISSGTELQGAYLGDHFPSYPG